MIHGFNRINPINPNDKKYKRAPNLTDPFLTFNLDLSTFLQRDSFDKKHPNNHKNAAYLLFFDFSKKQVGDHCIGPNSQCLSLSL